MQTGTQEKIFRVPVFWLNVQIVFLKNIVSCDIIINEIFYDVICC